MSMFDDATIARFWAKVDKNGPTPAHRTDLGPCWMWVGARNPKGYGNFGVGGYLNRRTVYPHRLAHELLVGPIPDDRVIDHLCRNTSCCNPDHLELVTQRVNALRGVNQFMAAHRENRCTRGHALTPDNIRRASGGRVRCRKCAQEHYRKTYVRKADRV